MKQLTAATLTNTVTPTNGNVWAGFNHGHSPTSIVLTQSF